MFHYDLNDLLLLQAISDCQNLTRGAEKIGLTAPSASVRIRKLENALKVKLLKRSPKGVELTSAGKLVVDQSKKVSGPLRAWLLRFGRSYVKKKD